MFLKFTNEDCNQYVMEKSETKDKEWIVGSPFLCGLLGTEQIEAFLPPVEDKTGFVLWSSGVKLSNLDPDDGQLAMSRSREI